MNPFFVHLGRVPKPPRVGNRVLARGCSCVLTNYHVIESADDIQVALSDRREFKARIVGVDPKTDLAVLSLQGQGFPVVPFGDSDRVEVAEPVMAIGNPFGLDRTVTVGIVSALGRANIGIVDYEDFIQTDAAINPGNSGGALINARGELIGINTAIFSEGGGYAGIGFAIPVNMARVVLNQIITYGRMRRGWLGVMIQELTPALGRGLGMPGIRGILIADVAVDRGHEDQIRIGEILREPFDDRRFDGEVEFPENGPLELVHRADRVHPVEVVHVFDHPLRKCAQEGQALAVFFCAHEPRFERGGRFGVAFGREQ